MTQNDLNPPTQELSVGQTLRQEREKRQLSLEQAAQQLKLRVEILHNLELDQPDKAILPTFMRGYLKSYARFLKLPEQALLIRFEQQHQVKSAPVKTMRTFSNRSAKQRTEARYMWLTWLIALVLLVSLAVWFWQSARENKLLQSDALPGPAQTVLAPTAELVSEQPLSAVELTTVEPELTTSEPETPTELDVTALPPAAQQQLEQLNQALQQEEAVSAVSEQPPQSLHDRLKMTFSDNCWIDVLDANGDRIAFGTKQAGYVMELNAKGPFVITLGNPGVVSIELNEQPYDMSRFPGNRVAKFTLSGQNE
ncbi:RodZ domain-containing protein [Alishewanella jeotgali]|uniref:DNA-binding protein n=1 Tax=Alishewanella jeotgali KCTC 22429 TaxID=1129374 RepID=H3ZCN4_9ALTE|nr:RodZ domain-containing protein [Alishewanella jeotgali]EHR41614.1 DNA-binding protein [Alishewanella jeotgali KCTC 22429]